MLYLRGISWVEEAYKVAQELWAITNHQIDGQEHSKTYKIQICVLKMKILKVNTYICLQRNNIGQRIFINTNRLTACKLTKHFTIN